MWQNSRTDSNTTANMLVNQNKFTLEENPDEQNVKPLIDMCEAMMNFSQKSRQEKFHIQAPRVVVFDRTDVTTQVGPSRPLGLYFRIGPG